MVALRNATFELPNTAVSQAMSLVAPQQDRPADTLRSHLACEAQAIQGIMIALPISMLLWCLIGAFFL